MQLFLLVKQKLCQINYFNLLTVSNEAIINALQSKNKQ